MSEQPSTAAAAVSTDAPASVKSADKPEPTGASADIKPARVSQSKLKTVASWLTSKDLSLTNVGSVARDHLANERTFLAWLRTSLALASIGVAISQLFRLSSSVYTIGATDISLPSPSAILPSPTNPQDVASAVASLIAIVGQQNDRIQALGTSVQNERDQYHKLGRPIGGAFVCLSLVMMVLGGHRYLSVQHHLTTSNLFPPARRSILVSTACIACLLVGTFVSLLVV